MSVVIAIVIVVVICIVTVIVINTSVQFAERPHDENGCAALRRAVASPRTRRSRAGATLVPMANTIVTVNIWRGLVK